MTTSKRGGLAAVGLANESTSGDHIGNLRFHHLLIQHALLDASSLRFSLVVVALDLVVRFVLGVLANAHQASSSFTSQANWQHKNGRIYDKTRVVLVHLLCGVRRDTNIINLAREYPSPRLHAMDQPKKQNQGAEEEEIRNDVMQVMQSLKRREPLDPTYRRFLMRGVVATVTPTLPSDKFYRKIGSDLRFRVEKFMQQTQGKDPFDRIANRQPIAV